MMPGRSLLSAVTENSVYVASEHKSHVAPIYYPQLKQLLPEWLIFSLRVGVPGFVVRGCRSYELGVEDPCRALHESCALNFLEVRRSGVEPKVQGLGPFEFRAWGAP